MRCAITLSHYTFDSPRQPQGVPIPHRGYTFDSAGLASATQPTLGNNAGGEATPLGVVLFPPRCFFMPSHTTLGGGNASRTPAPITQNKKVCVCYDLGITADNVICFKASYSLGVTADNAICFKTSYSLGVTVASP